MAFALHGHKDGALKPSQQVCAQRGDRACGLAWTIANVIVYLRDDGQMLKCIV